MREPATDLSPRDVHALLAWLIEAGADEVVLDAPVNRFAAAPAETAPAVAPAAQAEKGRPAAAPPADMPHSLVALAAALDAFADHPLRKTATRLAFVGGAPQARVLVLCDKPRNEEDKSGEVLAGKHQVLAERMLAAICLCGATAVEGREQVRLANYVPWRPPGNRSVTAQEAQLLLPYVQQLLDIARPTAILCLGALPGHMLAGGDEAVPKSRGKWLSVGVAGQPVPLLTTFHPETLLKSAQSKRLAWQDLQAFRRALDDLP